MTPPLVRIDGCRIRDRRSFHDEFARVMGFPNFYGRNMDAWIDCMTYLDEDDGMRSITIQPGEVLTLQIDHYRDLRARCPELAMELLECAAFVNFRRIEQGERPVLALSFFE
jgi:hypothetical protein